MIRYLILLLLSFGAKAQTPCSSAVYSGNGTSYTIGSNVNCSFEPLGYGISYCAMNTAQYNTASYCGTCLEVTGQMGSTIVYVIDQCLSCSSGDLDLSQDAFQATVGNLELGIGSITWKQVSCPLSAENVTLSNAVSNPYYAHFLIANHVNEIASVEIYLNSAWQNLTRQSDNYWINSGFSLNGDNFLNVRITDIYNEQLTLSNIYMNQDNIVYETSSNFTPCSNLELPEMNKHSEIEFHPNPVRSGSVLYFSENDINPSVSLHDLYGRQI